MFLCIDADGNGFLDRDELKACFIAMVSCCLLCTFAFSFLVHEYYVMRVCVLVSINGGLRMQGKIMGDKELDALIHEYDKDGNSLFDLVFSRLYSHTANVMKTIR